MTYIVSLIKDNFFQHVVQINFRVLETCIGTNFSHGFKGRCWNVLCTVYMYRSYVQGMYVLSLGSNIYGFKMKLLERIMSSFWVQIFMSTKGGVGTYHVISLGSNIHGFRKRCWSCHHFGSKYVHYNNFHGFSCSIEQCEIVLLFDIVLSNNMNIAILYTDEGKVMNKF